MKQGWQTKTLAEVCEVVNGGTPKTGVKEYWDGDFLWITPAEMGKRENPYASQTERKITAKGLKNSSAKLLPPKSVILSSRAPIGHLVINTEPMATNQGCKGLIPNNSLHYKYLYYYLGSKVEMLNDLGSGATFKELSGGKLKELPIPIASLPEQQRIVAILDEAFAAIAKAKANAEQNLKNAKELFESYLQSVSAEKHPLGELVNIKTGKLDSNAAIVGGQYPFFTCSRDVYAIDKFAFDCEAILLAGNNASGDFNVKHYKGKFNAYQRTYVIMVNQESRLLYRYLYVQMLNSLKEFKNKSVGANTKFLKLGMIKDLRIPLPSYAEQQAIVAKLDQLSIQTKKLEAIYQQKINDLEELKKSILQKAFNGELKTSEEVAA